MHHLKRSKKQAVTQPSVVVADPKNPWSHAVKARIVALMNPKLRGAVVDQKEQPARKQRRLLAVAALGARQNVDVADPRRVRPKIQRIHRIKETLVMTRTTKCLAKLWFVRSQLLI
ncbi:hypothetical protein TNIN_494361 [Trichonephila inaurata madagascariensis]|uniref:Uncharacterized protein n=1 Tax=Trichonephila inaurata madagascariensis TaxID=2747483 RepID=A0A8X6INM6_9ARAC|nr:hypothetical protein TNIN_494361 [Trichonephila inaurata madagascariensis]